MIDTVVKVCEKLVELLNHRAKVNRALFEDHIGPIYADAQGIVEDYRAVLNQVHGLLKPDPSFVAEAIEVLELRRTRLAIVREKLEYYAGVMEDSRPDTPIGEFARLCGVLVCSDPIVSSQNRRSTHLTSLINDLRLYQDQHDPQRSNWPLRRVEHYKEEIDEAWQRLSKMYFRLREELLA